MRRLSVHLHTLFIENEGQVQLTNEFTQKRDVSYWPD
jgi:hypothetical protein